MEIVYPHLMIDLCLCKHSLAIGNKRGVRGVASLRAQSSCYVDSESPLAVSFCGALCCTNIRRTAKMGRWTENKFLFHSIQ